MLDGYLCGVLAQPVPVDIAEWRLTYEQRALEIPG